MVMTPHGIDAAAPTVVDRESDAGHDAAVLDVVNRVSARLPLVDPADIELWVRREFRRHETDRVRQYVSLLVERTVTALLAPRS